MVLPEGKWECGLGEGFSHLHQCRLSDSLSGRTGYNSVVLSELHHCRHRKVCLLCLATLVSVVFWNVVGTGGTRGDRALDLVRSIAGRTDGQGESRENIRYVIKLFICD